MWQYLTQDNFNTLFVLLGWGWYALTWLAKWTKTTKDDEIVQIVNDKADWVKDKAGVIYDIIENRIKDGTISKENKLVQAMEMLHNAYIQNHGQKMPKILETTAQVVIEAKNAVDKVKKVRDDIALEIEQVKAKLKGEIGPNNEAVEEEESNGEGDK